MFSLWGAEQGGWVNYWIWVENVLYIHKGLIITFLNKKKVVCMLCALSIWMHLAMCMCGHQRTMCRVGYFYPPWVSSMFIHRTISPPHHEPHMIVCCALRGSLSSVVPTHPHISFADPPVSSAAAQCPWSLSAEDLPGSILGTILFPKLSCLILLI